ncbi:MAG: class I SAM-dependent methyltransferase [Actinomycetota bacterium]
MNSKLSRLVATTQIFGPFWTLQALFAVAVGKIPGMTKLSDKLTPEGYAERARFDRRYGLDTVGFDWSVVKTFDDELGEAAQGYEGANRRHILRVVESVPDTGPDTQFWDLGSGKGKAVFVAAMTGRFGKLVGVELGEYLVEAARKNTPIFKEKTGITTEIEWHHQSATEIEFPTDAPLVFFMYNPFIGDVFTEMMAILETHSKASSHPVHLVYAYPVCRDELEDRPGWTELFRQEIYPFYFDWIVYRLPGPDQA